MIKSQSAGIPTENESAAQDVQNKWDYSQEAIRYVHEKTRLNKGMILADINAGTGRLAKHFLKQANTVYCIEQNKQFRQIAAERFWKNRNFIEVNGTADQTHIESHAIDVITCGNGMRDCDAHRAIREFRRILKRDGWLVLMENVPLIDQTEIRPDGSSSMEHPYSRELMQFYYPGGPWEKKEYYFHARVREENLPDVLPGIPGSPPAEDVRNFWRENSREGHLCIAGKTILHIGQPCF